ncbi:MAG TPA: OmpA family protein [Xanthomonadaceae bacterium]|nr:OmpA family protein [Xanthomonadaceae bacterium]
MSMRICLGLMLALGAMNLTGCAWLVAQREPPPEPIVVESVVVEPERTVEPRVPIQAKILPHAILVLDLEDVDAELDLYRQALLDADRPALAPDDLGYFMDVLQARLLQRLGGTGVDFRREDDRVWLRLPAGSSFDSGSVRLDGEMRAALDLVGKAIAGFDQVLLSVHGHTDATGPLEVNRRISEQRALAVARYLVDEHHVAASVAIVGHGPLNPVASNDTPEERARNRRVELRIDPLVR